MEAAALDAEVASAKGSSRNAWISLETCMTFSPTRSQRSRCKAVLPLIPWPIDRSWRSMPSRLFGHSRTRPSPNSGGPSRPCGELTARVASPRLGEIAGIADQARRAGLEVSLTLPAEAPALSQFSEVTAFRIVQESVTNVIRHASARRVGITVTLVEKSLAIDVTDDGNGQRQQHSEGLGMRGMRERAQLVGGTFTAGRNQQGGFHVHAELPVASA